MSDRKYDAESSEAKLGAAGEDRAENIVRGLLQEGYTSVFDVRRGPKNPTANAKMGDLLISALPYEAPVLSIEVKTSSARYPDSVSITDYELKSSRAEYLMGLNEDPTLGVWVVRMETVRQKAVRPRRAEGYVVFRPGPEDRIPLDVFASEMISALEKGR